MRNEEVAKLDFSGWPVPDEFLTEIGRVTALWASLESFLDICIGKLAGFNDQSDPRPFILVTHSSFPQRVDILATLCEQLHPEFQELAAYKDVVSSLKSAQKARNRYAHNTMSFDKESGSIQMPLGSARGKLKISVQKVAIEDIKRACVEIDEASRALYKLVLKRDLPATWPRPSA